MPPTRRAFVAPLLLVLAAASIVAVACDSGDDPAGAAPDDAGATGDGGTSTNPGPEDAATPTDASVVDDSGVAKGASALRSKTHTTCTLRASGAVACWGSNIDGQLGDGTKDPRLSPVDVVGVTGAVEVSAGQTHTCARKSDGTVLCWGRASDGQLGDGDDAKLESLTPVTVLGLADAVQLAAGTHHTCARRATGTVACWGENAFGKIGDGAGDNHYAPFDVPGVTDVVQVAATFHTCALRANGTVYCWGNNSDGQIGDNSTSTRRSPVQVVGLSDAVQISVGASTTCARRASGTVVCWGSNASGRLGIGSTDSAAGVLVPTTEVVGLTDAVQISAGHTSACALRATGAVVCWGSNNYGQLGNGTKGTASGTPGPVTGLNDAVSVVVGQWHACAQRASGQVVCWGTNTDAQLGDGTLNEKLVPVAVAGLP